jgi:hypothetical protein
MGHYHLHKSLFIYLCERFFFELHYLDAAVFFVVSSSNRCVYTSEIGMNKIAL